MWKYFDEKNIRNERYVIYGLVDKNKSAFPQPKNDHLFIDIKSSIMCHISDIFLSFSKILLIT